VKKTFLYIIWLLYNIFCVTLCLYVFCIIKFLSRKCLVLLLKQGWNIIGLNKNFFSSSLFNATRIDQTMLVQSNALCCCGFFSLFVQTFRFLSKSKHHSSKLTEHLICKSRLLKWWVSYPLFMSLVADLALPLYLHWTADAIRTAVVKKDCTFNHFNEKSSGVASFSCYCELHFYLNLLFKKQCSGLPTQQRLEKECTFSLYHNQKASAKKTCWVFNLFKLKSKHSTIKVTGQFLGASNWKSWLLRWRVCGALVFTHPKPHLRG